MSPWYKVSILVLLESGLGAQSLNNRARSLLSFNPCSAGIRSGRCHPVQLVWVVFFVSILVLLESGLGENFQLQQFYQIEGFNPCSAGIRSGRIKQLFYHIFGVGFNPCSAGIRSGRIIEMLKQVETWSFNPCSAGIRSGRLNQGKMPNLTTKFQSLFCWNQVWELLLWV